LLLVLFCYVIPELIEIVSCLRRYKKGQTSGGASCLIHIQDSELLTGFLLRIGLEVHG
jgi:hypothetical protein